MRLSFSGPAPNTVNELGEPVYDPLKDFELATQKVRSHHLNFNLNL